MMPSNIRSRFRALSFHSDVRAAFSTGISIAALLTATVYTHAQAATATPDAAAQAAPAAPQAEINLSNESAAKTRKQKDDKVVLSKDTKQAEKKAKKDNPLAGMDTKLPDKELYDKAEDAIKHGRFDVGRLDLQTLLNTYPDSEYMAQAKLAIADSWFKEGGTASLTQAEQEYKDFITFFPNAKEAAEAQMRVGDIYFRQMDKPDRDYSMTTHAEEEYRLMLQEFPDSVLVPQAKQKLREVQEVMASREADIARFYEQRQPPNLNAAIARYQTVVDTYPLYSHMDDVLIGIGDAYETFAHSWRNAKAPPRLDEASKAQFEEGRARLEKLYDDQAAAAYRKVVLEHSAAPHVEDARDRLVGMGLPVPTPTAEQVAASTALESSRGQYTLSKRAVGIFLHQADTVPAATVGEPPLEHAKATYAPGVIKDVTDNYLAAMNPNMAAKTAPAVTAANAPATQSDPGEAAPAAVAPLAFGDVPAAGSGAAEGSSAVVTSVPAATAGPSSGSSMGISIVQPGPDSGSSAPATAPGTVPAFPGTQALPNNNGGLKAVGPDVTAPLAPIEKAATAPDAINEVTPGSQPAAQTPPANGKKPKPALDKSDESSSKKKPKKGLAKLNPF